MKENHTLFRFRKRNQSFTAASQANRANTYKCHLNTHVYGNTSNEQEQTKFYLLVLSMCCGLLLYKKFIIYPVKSNKRLCRSMLDHCILLDHLTHSYSQYSNENNGYSIDGFFSLSSLTIIYYHCHSYEIANLLLSLEWQKLYDKLQCSIVTMANCHGNNDTSCSPKTDLMLGNFYFVIKRYAIRLRINKAIYLFARHRSEWGKEFSYSTLSFDSVHFYFVSFMFIAY